MKTTHKKNIALACAVAVSTVLAGYTWANYQPFSNVRPTTQVTQATQTAQTAQTTQATQATQATQTTRKVPQSRWNTASTTATSTSKHATASTTSSAKSTTTTSSASSTTTSTTSSSATTNVVDATSNTITLNNQSVRITKGGTYTLSGKIADGQVIVDVGEDVAVTLKLAGVDITSSTSSPILITSGKATVHLVAGTVNTLTDGTYAADADENATLYAKEDLVIDGTGTLIVNANGNDGITSKDDLKILNGNITVKSTDDAIRGKDSLVISGGKFTITAGGDALKADNETKAGKGYVHITGGDFTISAGSDGIQGITTVTIDGGKINIKTSREGIEATQVVINGGDISIYATDDGINASQNGLSDGTDIKITINGGNLNISMAQGDTDAIDSNGDLVIAGGTINITAQSAFDFDGKVTHTGGDITVNGQKVTTVTNSMMGGGMRGGMMWGAMWGGVMPGAQRTTSVGQASAGFPAGQPTQAQAPSFNNLQTPQAQQNFAPQSWQRNEQKFANVSAQWEQFPTQRPERGQRMR